MLCFNTPHDAYPIDYNLVYSSTSDGCTLAPTSTSGPPSSTSAGDSLSNNTTPTSSFASPTFTDETLFSPPSSSLLSVVEFEQNNSAPTHSFDFGHLYAQEASMDLPPQWQSIDADTKADLYSQAYDYLNKGPYTCQQILPLPKQKDPTFTCSTHCSSAPLSSQQRKRAKYSALPCGTTAQLPFYQSAATIDCFNDTQMAIKIESDEEGSTHMQSHHGHGIHDSTMNQRHVYTPQMSRRDLELPTPIVSLYDGVEEEVDELTEEVYTSNEYSGNHDTGGNYDGNVEQSSQDDPCSFITQIDELPPPQAYNDYHYTTQHLQAPVLPHHTDPTLDGFGREPETYWPDYRQGYSGKDTAQSLAPPPPLYAPIESFAYSHLPYSSINIRTPKRETNLPAQTYNIEHNQDNIKAEFDDILHEDRIETKKDRAQSACTNCHKRKTKCSTESPCSNCIKRGLICEYPEFVRRRGKGKAHRIKDLSQTYSYPITAL